MPGRSAWVLDFARRLYYHKINLKRKEVVFMKKISKLILLVLAAAMLVGMISGCETMESKMQAKIEALAGKWTLVEQESEEQAQILLENIDAYEEEIALADLSSLSYVRLVEFDTEKNYRFAFDVEGTKACVRAFYAGYFEALYAGRASLNDAYGMEFDTMTEEEFQQFFAEVYGYDEFEPMLDYFAEVAYDYDSLGEDLETGTFTIVGDDIMCTITGETEAESLGYTLEGDVLTLTYADAVEVYSRSAAAE